LGASTSALADGHVGDIQYSLLSEKDFQQLHGKEWEVMRGQKVPWDSELRNLWNRPHLPDARGVFLRSAHFDRPSVEGNPESSNSCGDSQMDEIKSHTHQDSGHGHGCEVNLGSCNNTGSNPGPAQGSGGGWKNSPLHGHAHTGYASIQPTGERETRPRCIIVNTFIKIRATPQEASTPQVGVKAQASQQQITELFNRTEFKSAFAKAFADARKNIK
jgi:hypothetical protein